MDGAPIPRSNQLGHAYQVGYKSRSGATEGNIAMCRSTIDLAAERRSTEYSTVAATSCGIGFGLNWMITHERPMPPRA
jgi:hypothetical protein